MSSKNSSRRLLPVRLAYAGLWVVTALLVALWETDVMPRDYVPSSPDTDYALSLVSVVTAIGGTYLALRLMSFKRLRRRLKATVADEPANVRAYLGLSAVRVGIIATAIFVNIVIYYASTYVTSARYCALIALIGAVFCWPSDVERRHLSGENAEADHKQDADERR